MNIRDFILLHLKKANPVSSAIFIHLITCVFLHVLFQEFVPTILHGRAETLIRWDVEWYLEIKEYGYTFIQGEQNSMAFFPLFPLLWSILNLNTLGICILNLLVFYVSYFFLARHLNFNFQKSLFCLSIPLFFFCYVPYSESFFYAGSTMLLIGLDKNNKILIIGGIIIAGLTRSVGLIFIPSFLFCFIVLERNFKVRKVIPIALYVSIVVCTTLVVFYFQYLNTGEWFVFFETQRAWRRELQFPKLPFDSSSGPFVFLLDVSALAVVMGSGLYAVRVLHTRFFKNKDSYIAFTSSFLFSICYLFLVGLISIFYSGVWHKGAGSLLMSLSRFVFVSPFFVVAIALIRKDKFILKNKLIITSAIILICFLLYGGKYNGGQPQIGLYHKTAIFLNQFIYLITFIFINNRVVLFVLFFINCILQLFFFHSFLSGYWVA